MPPQPTPQRPRRTIFLIMLAGVATLILLVAVAAIATAVGRFQWAQKQHWLAVSMGADRPIRDVKVKVCGRSYTFGPIIAHSMDKQRFEISSNSDFEVSGSFADGHTFSGRCGWVTPATPPGQYEIIVNEDGTLYYNAQQRP